jgi:hypothetical protein
MPSDIQLLAEHAAGLSYAALAAKYALKPDSVRGRISRQKRGGRPRKSAPPPIVQLAAKPRSLRAAAQPVGLPPPALTDLRYLDPATDQGAFLQRLHAARADGGYTTVMHLCDIHTPYQHAPALDVTYQLVRHVKPGFVVVGSDFFDFSSLSSFPQDADDAERDDALDAVEGPYNAHIAAVTKAAPDAALVFVLGNHEKRVFDYINRQAPQVRRTVWRRFVDIIRCGGRVLWLGEVDSVRFGPLRVMHGNRHNQHVAASLLQDAGYQMHVMAGHVHRLTFANRRGEDYPVSAITSGCLCHHPAPYMRRKTPTQKWMLGTAIAEVNLRGRDVHLDNLEYQMDADTVWTRFERRTFAAALPRPAGLISFDEWQAAKARQEAA